MNMKIMVRVIGAYLDVKFSPLSFSRVKIKGFYLEYNYLPTNNLQGRSQGHGEGHMGT